MKLVGLIRVSTEEQAADGRAGIARQQHEIEQIASREGADLIKVVTLIDVSGSDVGETPEWQNQVVPQLRAGAHLVVDEISRVARPDKFDFSLVASLQETGVKVYTPSGPTELSTPEGYMKAAMGAVFGGMEKLTLKRRVREGKEAIRRDGGHAGPDITLPLGCTYNRATKRWEYTEDAWKVQRAFEMFVVEGQPMAQIGREIGLTLQGVRVVLENPIYMGIRVYDQKRGIETYQRKNGRQPERKKVRRSDDEIIRVQVYGGADQEPALIDESQWRRAHTLRLNARKKAAKRRAKSQPKVYFTGFLLSGRPGRADHVLYGKTSNLRKDYYVCRCRDTATRGNRVPCGLRGLPADLTNRALDKLLVKLCRNHAWHKAMIQEVVGSQDDRDRQVRVLRGQIQEIKGKMEVLVDLLMDGRIHRTTHDNRWDKLQKSLDGAQAELDQLQDAGSGPTEEDLEAHARSLQYGAQWDHKRKRAWLSEHVAAIYVDEEGITGIVWRLPMGTTWTWATEYSWVDLLGHRLDDRNARSQARRKAKGVYHASDVAARLGLKPEQLRYLMRGGRLPIPEGRIGKSHKRLWTEDDLAATVDAYTQLNPS